MRKKGKEEKSSQKEKKITKYLRERTTTEGKFLFVDLLREKVLKGLQNLISLKNSGNHCKHFFSPNNPPLSPSPQSSPARGEEAKNM
ncbi:MAG: hypothetical protein ABIJ15_02020 [bacterium]